MTQLALQLEPPQANPNAHFFNADGSPKRLLWCSDSARLGGPCPYLEPRPSLSEPGTTLPPIGRDRMPAGGCCKDLASEGAHVQR